MRPFTFPKRTSGANNATSKSRQGLLQCAVAVGVVGVISTAGSLGNGFAVDDYPIIVQNPQVQHLAPPWTYLLQSYWPPGTQGDLYRPWTVWWFALQVWLGGGSPLAFRVTSIMLSALCAVLVLVLVREVTSLGAALIGTLLFAAHPVHTEAVYSNVGQAELWMTSFVLAGAIYYLRQRRAMVAAGQKGGLPPKANGLLLLLFLLATLSKEQGLVLPAILLALEVSLFRGRAAGQSRPQLTRTFSQMFLLAVAVVAWRLLLLGDLGGGSPAAPLSGAGVLERALVMAPLYLDWLRLTLWPTTLRTIYSPPQFGNSTGASAGLAVLFLALASVVAAVALTHRRWPGIALGLATFCIASVLTSNIAFPTAFLIAERTFFLPTVGVALVVAAVADSLSAPRARALAMLGAAVLVLLGLCKSWTRATVWRDNEAFYTHAVVDSPRSYLAHYFLALHRYREGDPAKAIRSLQFAATLYGHDPQVFETLGVVLRQLGHLDRAAEAFDRALAVDPTRSLTRIRLVETLVSGGRFDQARAVAGEGVRLGQTTFAASLDRIRQKEREAAPERSRPLGAPGTSQLDRRN